MTVLDRDEELLSVGDKQFFFCSRKVLLLHKKPSGQDAHSLFCHGEVILMVSIYVNIAQ